MDAIWWQLRFPNIRRRFAILIVGLLAASCTTTGADVDSVADSGSVQICLRTSLAIDHEDNGTVDGFFAYAYSDAGFTVQAAADVDEPVTGTIAFNFEAAAPTLQYKGDGTVDMLTTYDFPGNLRTRDRDADGDGTLDDRWTYTYDSDGRLQTIESDERVDGSVDFTTTYAYDTSAKVRTKEYRDDRAVAFLFTCTYATDTLVTEQDTSGDGSVNALTTYGYTDEAMVVEYDTNADAVIDFRYSYTYDDAGNIGGAELDDGADGTVNTRYTYAYDCG